MHIPLLRLVKKCRDKIWESQDVLTGDFKLNDLLIARLGKEDGSCNRLIPGLQVTLLKQLE